MFLSRSFEAFHDGVLLDDFSELLDPIPAYDHSVDFALVARCRNCGPRAACPKKDRLVALGRINRIVLLYIPSTRIAVSIRPGQASGVGTSER